MSLQFDFTGCTRTVILTRRWAIKLPGLWAYSPCEWWRGLLYGLLANMQEAKFSKTGWPELCPVSFALPGGFLVVMPRARVMSDDEFIAFDVKAFLDRPNYTVPAEAKSNSFGFLDGRIVAIDYGSRP